MVEKEMKFLVNLSKFNNVLDFAYKMYGDNSVRLITQTNYYYDTHDLNLYKNGITLRIRQIEKEKTLQLKKNKQFKDGVRIANEFEKHVSEIPDFLPCETVNLNYSNNYFLLGKLVTTRTRFKLSDGTNIDFDISNYFNKTDYEIEIELGTNPPNNFISELDSDTHNFRGKYERFIKLLNSTNNR